MSSKQPYIGAPVTLISSLDVRYEGVLFTIDPNESTVALQNVKCLGTEDRQPPGEKSIPKSDTVYEFIIFRGENIKSISLLEKNEAKEDRPPIPDPSILKVGPSDAGKSSRHMPQAFDMNRDYNRRPPQRQYRNERYQDNRRQYNNNRFQDNRRQNGQRQYNQRPRQYRQNYNNNRGYRNNNYRRNNYQQRRQYDPESAPGTGKFLMKGNDENQELSLQGEFDFEAANALFEKNIILEEEENKEQSSEEKKEASPEEKQEKTEEQQENNEGSEEKDKEVEPEAEPKPAEPKTEYTYNPDNFFDDLDDGKDSRSYKQDLKARRAVDAQTFGDVAKSYSPRVFRRRRYRPNNRQNNYYRRNNYNNRDDRRR